MMNIKLVNKSGNEIPKYATNDSAGIDLRAFISDPIIIEPLNRVIIPTGVYIELPTGYEAQIRPRSGLAANHGITVLNTPGTIDADYRGEIKVIMINLSNEPYIVNNNDKICQMVISEYVKVNIVCVESLNDDTERSVNGFGHTGKN